jgi:hypothetical protein
MSDEELSLQQRDPLAGYGLRPVTLLMSIGIVVLSAASTLLAWPQAGDMVAAYLAVVLTAVIVSLTAFWSDPLRAPFWHVGFVVIAVLQLAVLGLTAVATWATDSEELMRWASVIVGLTIAQLAPYRPTREVAGMTGVAGVSAALLAILKPESDTPHLVALVNAALPLLALGVGATVYSSTLAETRGRWYARFSQSDTAAGARLRESILRSVQQDRVSILNHSVVPFFSDLLERGKIDDDDRRRAREIATSIRAVMVADVDRSWLDTVVDQVAALRGDEATPGSEVVQDPDRLAGAMTTEQRTVLRALIIALFDHPGFDPDGFAVVIAKQADACAATITTKLDADDSIPRSGLAAYFAVLRIAFGDLQLTFDPPTLTLRFSYDHA